jgi:hypothetical protein
MKDAISVDNFFLSPTISSMWRWLSPMMLRHHGNPKASRLMSQKKKASRVNYRGANHPWSGRHKSLAVDVALPGWSRRAPAGPMGNSGRGRCGLANPPRAPPELRCTHPQPARRTPSWRPTALRHQLYIPDTVRVRTCKTGEEKRQEKVKKGC